jgi:hypothetical protein
MRIWIRVLFALGPPKLPNEMLFGTILEINEKLCLVTTNR